MKSGIRCSLAIAALEAFTLAAFARQDTSAVISIKNDHISISFDRANGRMIEFVDRSTNTGFVGRQARSSSLWEINFLPGSEPSSISSSSAKSFRWSRLPDDPSQLNLVWENFDILAAPKLRVEATVSLATNEPISRWRIGVNSLNNLGIENVRFPRIIDIPEQQNERLAAPIWMGELMREPRKVIIQRGHRLEWPYPGTLSLQCLALYSENGPGLYLSCDDTSAFRKAFALWSDGGSSINYEMVHHPENQLPPPTSYVPSYHAVIGTFIGDWFTAAERYRAWGTLQHWAKNSRLNKGLVPDWLSKTGLWVWNRGRSDNVLKPAVALQKELQMPVSVFWHWWHGCAYDIGFPEYLPPREGTDPFRIALADAQRQGLRAIVYMNQRLWGMTTKSWVEKDAERYAVKSLDGTVRPEVYNTYTGQACASMCMATPFWRGTYAGIAEAAICSLGVDGIYMDQACSSLLCYDPTHGHPLGGGTFWIDGFRMLSSDIRVRAQPVKNVVLAGEGSGEAWLPYLDLMLTLQVSRERYARPGDGSEVVPFFQAVYHAYGITYGSYSSLTIPPYDELWPAEFAPKEPLRLLDRNYASQFYLEQARTFVWGVQPTIANFLPTQLRERPEEIAYLIRLARIRYHAQQYLLAGTFLRPPVLNVPAVEFESSRLSIYAGRRGKEDTTRRRAPSDDGIDDSGRDKASSEGRIVTPGVLGAAWRSRDGNVGIALASILDTPTSFVLDLKPYGMTDRTRVFTIDERGRRELSRAFRDPALPLTLQTRGACVVEIVK